MNLHAKDSVIIESVFGTNVNRAKCQCGHETGFAVIEVGDTYQCNGCKRDTRIQPVKKGHTS